MPAADAAALLRSNADDPDRRDRPALRFADRVWTHAEYVAECHRFANLFLERRPAGASRGTHVGVLLDNTPDYVFALGGAALAGATVVGLNHTRRDEHLLRDLQHTDCDLVVTEPRHLALLDPITKGLPEVLVSRRPPRRRRRPTLRSSVPTSTTPSVPSHPRMRGSSPDPTRCGASSSRRARPMHPRPSSARNAASS